MNEKTQKKQRGLILGVIVGILIIYLFSNLTVNKKLNYINDNLNSLISEELENTKDLAKIVVRNGTNEQTKNFLIRACSSEETANYEELLSNINKELSHSSLQELNQLFNHCGYYDIEKRSLMTFQLRQSVEKLELFNHLGQGALKKDLVVNLTDWQTFLNKEEEINKSFIKLAEIQREIIIALLNGEKNGSVILEGLRQRAGEIRGEADLLTSDVSEISSKLLEVNK